MRTRHPVQPGRRLGMALENWPPADQQAWSRAFAPASPLDDIFEDGSPGAELRVPSRDTLATCYARWLIYLTKDHPGTLTLTLAARVNQDRVLGYLHMLHNEVSLRSVYNYGVRLKRALELMAPSNDWSWFVPILRRAERRARGARAPDQPFVHSQKLYMFGIELMKKAQANTAMQPQARAEEYRNGLMIAFLAARPIRLRNMFELEIGTHLTEVRSGFRVFIPRTKTGAELDFPLPAHLSPYMSCYLTDHHNVLAAGPHGAVSGRSDQRRFVWLARSGAQFPADTFEHMIALRTLEKFGVRLTPHDFRHCAATAIAENNPEEFHIIRIILGHATLAMAEQNYIHAKRNESARLLHNVVAKKRRELADMLSHDSSGADSAG